MNQPDVFYESTISSKEIYIDHPKKNVVEALLVPGDLQITLKSSDSEGSYTTS